MTNLPFSIVLGLLILNIASFIIVGADKKKSVYGDTRIPEVSFFVWSVFFASLGVLLGMFFFHHKTRKWYFTFGIGLLVLQQALLIFLLTKFISF